jgi:hypothetical protein
MAKANDNAMSIHWSWKCLNSGRIYIAQTNRLAVIRKASACGSVFNHGTLTGRHRVKAQLTLHIPKAGVVRDCAMCDCGLFSGNFPLISGS